jgi:protein-S-isoprenylcysteine O-methyltransferase Ste14
MSVPASAHSVRAKGRPISWRRLGDIGLCFLLMLFAYMRVMAAIESGRESDGLAVAHHLIVGVSLLIMSVLPIIRRSAVARGEGFFPKAVATVGGYIVIPLGLLPLTWRPDWLLTATTLGLMAATLFEIWALLTLRRSFSVFPEARKLVTHGPYGLVRHPLYSAYLASYMLVALPRFGVPAMIFAALGITAQVMRARREEDVLRGAFPEYDDYAARVPRFLPRLYRGSATVPPHAAPATATEQPDEALAA